MNQKKPLTIAVQMDAIDSINYDSDSSFILALEAQNRGFRILYYQPKNLSLQNGKVIANVQEITLKANKDKYFSLGKIYETDFSDIDFILMRQDPPFDMNYLTYTYFLEMLPTTIILNSPKNVRDCPEKIFACKFADLMPPTLISSDILSIATFHKKYKEIVVKPLYAFGGRDVFLIKSKDDLEKHSNYLIEKYNCPLVAQKFLPNIVKGDKRVILIDGKIAGALNRIPQKGNIRSNLASGGTAQKTTLSDKEKEICKRVGKELKKRNLLLAGIDIIDGNLTEINVTSPTGLRVINRLYGTNPEKIFWDAVIKKFKKNASDK